MAKSRMQPSARSPRKASLLPGSYANREKPSSRRGASKPGGRRSRREPLHELLPQDVYSSSLENVCHCCRTGWLVDCLPLTSSEWSGRPDGRRTARRRCGRGPATTLTAEDMLVSGNAQSAEASPSVRSTLRLFSVSGRLPDREKGRQPPGGGRVSLLVVLSEAQNNDEGLRPGCIRRALPYVRHMEASRASTGWPSCRTEPEPSAPHVA